MTMADRVVVMNAGLVEQVGPPQELYHSPASLFVAGFIGSPSMNFLEAELIDRDGVPAVRLADGTLLAIPAQRLAGYAPHVGKAVTFGIRPESISPRQEREGFASIDVMVDPVEPLGPSTMIYFDVANITLCASISPDSGARPQTTMPISVNMNQMHLFDRESGRSLRT